MTTLLFYKETTALNREQSKTLRFTPSTDFSFASDVNSVPLTGIEFFEASRDLPVLFSRDESGNYSPLALLSLVNNGHLLNDEGGTWGDVYIPAFIRRYPFALSEDTTVCFDSKAPHFQKDEGESLFTDEGDNTETLNNIVNFLNNYDSQQKVTQAYCAECAECAEHDLFKPFNIQVMLENNKPLRLDGLFTIDEQKLIELADNKVGEWFKKGWLAWSYAHMHSLGALRRLVKRQQTEEVENNSNKNDSNKSDNVATDANA